MKVWSFIIFLLQVLAGAYGLLSEFAPADWSIPRLPPGGGLTLALVAATMAFTLAVVDQERRDREEAKQRGAVGSAAVERLTAALAAHEREFFALWPTQVASALNNVDVTHLGPRPPQAKHGAEESQYFADFKKMVKGTKAEVRRVERLTFEKVGWLKTLVEQLGKQPNFSLRGYLDPSQEDLPFALSVSRVDLRVAWIVAMAEHTSTVNYRDLMITGADAVQLVAHYFNVRLWDRGIKIIERGEVVPNWEEEVQRVLGGKH